MALIIQLLRAMATTAHATTTVYTPSVSAVVSNLRVATTGTAGTVNVFLDPSGAAGPRRVAVKDKSLGVKELFVVKPEITMGPGDSILMIDWLPQHPCRPRFKWVAYVPLDAAPFYPPWEGLLRDMDEVVAMSQAGLEFARTLHWDALMPEWLEVIGGETIRLGREKGRGGMLAAELAGYPFTSTQTTSPLAFRA